MRLAIQAAEVVRECSSPDGIKPVRGMSTQSAIWSAYVRKPAGPIRYFERDLIDLGVIENLLPLGSHL